VEPKYASLWRNYQTLLKQRNHALKQNWSKEMITPWNQQLDLVVSTLTQMHRTAVEKINTILQNLVENYTSWNSVTLSYYPGWATDLGYREALDKSWKSDREKGITAAGPHRSDLRITINDAPAKNAVSRGQQKFLALLLKVAATRFVELENAKKLIILVDDLAAEMDQSHTERSAGLLSECAGQLIITAIEAEDMRVFPSSESLQMFHVKHGEFSEMV
jgi:DNA replication and repair protein RecF